MCGISCELELEYASEEIALMIMSSVSPDNEGYITIEKKDEKLICKAEAEGPLKLLQTLDDFLACVSVAEETVIEE